MIYLIHQKKHLGIVLFFTMINRFYQRLKNILTSKTKNNKTDTVFSIGDKNEKIFEMKAKVI